MNSSIENPLSYKEIIEIMNAPAPLTGQVSPFFLSAMAEAIEAEKKTSNNTNERDLRNQLDSGKIAHKSGLPK
jgi:hypothetical protein